MLNRSAGTQHLIGLPKW